MFIPSFRASFISDGSIAFVIKSKTKQFAACTPFYNAAFCKNMTSKTCIFFQNCTFQDADGNCVIVVPASPVGDSAVLSIQIVGR